MNILYIRFEDYPYGTASSFRAFTLSKLIVEAGHKITIIAPNINFKDDEIDDKGLYKNWKNIKTISINECDDSINQILENTLHKEKYDLFMRPTSIKKYNSIFKTIKKYNLPTVMDAVEWYDYTNWRLGKFDPRYYYFQFLWRFKFNKSNGIISISRMIETYFKKSLSNVVRIPTITDVKNTCFRTKISNEKIKFIFSGKLDEGKDNIDSFIKALVLVDHNGDLTEFHIYGPNIEEVKKHLGNDSELLDTHKNHIYVHGRVSQHEAQKSCLNSDFSVFFRLNRRSANAGFPTKLGECMTFGTPVICNDTGDISLVVKNRVNGFLLNTKSTEEITDTLKYIINMSLEERIEMRKRARNSAEDFFDYRNYISEIQNVIENALEERK